MQGMVQSGNHRRVPLHSFTANRAPQQILAAMLQRDVHIALA
jgi:hypothetical protein